MFQSLSNAVKRLLPLRGRRTGKVIAVPGEVRANDSLATTLIEDFIIKLLIIIIIIPLINYHRIIRRRRTALMAMVDGRK